MIAIIDYGLGNIRAFANILRNLNAPFKIVKESKELIAIEKIILPGVGAFDHVMTKLIDSGMKDKIAELVHIQKIPILGVCVGMQILAKSSEEGKLNGLGWINGTVKLIDTTKIDSRTKLPHMGWNEVYPVRNNSLFSSLENGEQFYFLHSYYFACNERNDESAITYYGGSFCSAIHHGNIFGVQFHPEKSHRCGVKLLENFVSL